MFGWREMFALLLLGFASSLSTGSDKESELLELVSTAHRATRESIRTFHCRVNFEITATVGVPPAPIKQTCRSEYWHSESAVRVKVADGSQTIDYAWSDNIEKALVWRGKDVAATRAAFPNRYTHRGDAWIRGLLVINQAGTGRYLLFEDLVAAADKVVSVQRRRLDDRELIAVKLRMPAKSEGSPPWELELHFDPSVNYLIRSVTRFRGRQQNDVEEVVSFKDLGGGLYFPERIVGRGPDGSPESVKSEGLLTEIQINKALPEGIFRLKYPEGILLTDSIRGTMYKVSSDGEPLSKEKPLGTIPPPPPSTKDPDAESGTVSQEESSDSTRWIMPISVAMLAIGAACAAYRRWKSRRD